MRLNVATRQWHALVDDPWLLLLQPNVERVDYVTQLVRTYGLVAPFEAACRYTPGVGRVVDFRQLTRAGLIAQDLLALGLSPAQIATLQQCPSITPFADITDAFGWLYVVERMTLLHDGIRRHLLARLPALADACAYLSQYDGRVNEHWSTFGRILDRVGSRADLANRIIATARTAFDVAHGWFRSVRSDARSTG